MIVTTYGIMEIRFGDTTLLCAARDLIPLQRPNRRHAFVAPSGENFTKDYSCDRNKSPVLQ